MSRHLVSTLIAATVLAACGQEKPPAPTVRPVLTQVVGGDRAGAPTAVYSGDIRARYENDLAFRVAGKVVQRSVEVGALVKRSQVLARLDPQDQQLQVEAARAQLAGAEADRALARAELERNKSLRAQNFISQAVLDQKQQLFDAAQARIRQINAQLDGAKNSAGYTTLVAERDGVITAALVEPGQVVAIGQPVFRFARLDEREVLINVPEGRLGEWRTASASAPVIGVRLVTKPERVYPGRVREIAPTADVTTRTFNVRIAVLEADDDVKLGLTANVIVTNPGAPRDLIVPLAALGEREGKPALWIVDTKALTVSPIPVETGAYREDGVVIRSGLAGGETIVVAGVQKLVVGQAVRLTKQ